MLLEETRMRTGGSEDIPENRDLVHARRRDRVGTITNVAGNIIRDKIIGRGNLTTFSDIDADRGLVHRHPHDIDDDSNIVQFILVQSLRLLITYGTRS